ncbi:unnamed protein product [Brassica oleracea]
MGSASNPLVTSSVVDDSPLPSNLTQDDLKKLAAYKAVEYVKSGMVVGLGTGSTAKHAVARISELLRQGKLRDIIGIPTSTTTHEQAVSLGIPLSDLDSHPVVDLSIDGADEVDPALNLVKGRGGSLLREKMVEGASKKFVVIVDESKLVKHLGGSGLAVPVEVVPFCCDFTRGKLEELFREAGCKAKLRVKSGGETAAVTDNGNYVVDLYLERDMGDLEAASEKILRLPGVVEHGMFLGIATTLIVAGKSGVTVKDRFGLNCKSGPELSLFYRTNWMLHTVTQLPKHPPFNIMFYFTVEQSKFYTEAFHSLKSVVNYTVGVTGILQNVTNI